jgi:hypothetical protein
MKSKQVIIMSFVVMCVSVASVWERRADISQNGCVPSRDVRAIAQQPQEI